MSEELRNSETARIHLDVWTDGFGQVTIVFLRTPSISGAVELGMTALTVNSGMKKKVIPLICPYYILILLMITIMCV